MLGFDDAPAPAPAPVANTGASSEFGVFQVSSTPAGASDDFAAFDQIRSKAQQGPDPFAAAPAPVAPAQQFDAFGNNAAAAPTNNMMNGNMMNNNNMMMNNNMVAMGNAFGNMSMGAPAVGMQNTTPAVAINDDDFGDFADAKPTPSIASTVQKSSDPLAGLINLDSLTKNPSKKMTMNQPVFPGAAAAQYQQAMQNGAQGQTQSQGELDNGRCACLPFIHDLLKMKCDL